MEILELLSSPWVQRAFIAALFAGVTCGLLGCFIMLRNMSMVGDALSHAVLPGIVVAFAVAGYSLMAFFIGAIAAGLLAAVLITLLQRNVHTKSDAAIGIVFTAMFASGVMGISALTRGEGVHLDLKDFLFGNVLGISDNDLLITGLITLFTLFSITLLYRYLFLTTFDTTLAKAMGLPSGILHYFLMLLLAFSVVASLQSVGVILVVAMLIVPASTAYLLTNQLSKMLVLACILGAGSAILGLIISLILDTTPGPAMTLCGTFFYVLAVLFSPSRGLVFRNKRRQSALAQITKG